MRRRSSLLLALALLLPAAAFAPVNEAAAKVSRKKSIWGPVERAGKSQFPIYEELGVGIWQTTLSWNAIAPTEPAEPRDATDPAYQWPAEVDAGIAEARKHGMQVSLLVIGAPSWANGGRDQRWAPANPAPFADFVEAASRRYPAVRHWMIWGEPTKASNFQPLSKAQTTPVRGRGKTGVQRYARLLDAAYVRLKSVSRRNLVIGGNTFTTGVISPKQFIPALRQPNGKRPRMDMWGHNPFSLRKPTLSQGPLPSGFADFADLDTLTRWIDRAGFRTTSGRRLPLFLSELSLPTDHANVEFNYWFSRREQANWLREALPIVRRWNRIYTLGYLGLYDDPKQADNRQVERGLITREGVRKPAFEVFKKG